MNISILLSSCEYLQHYDLIVSMSIWLNNQLTDTKSTQLKLLSSLLKEDYEVSKILVRYIDLTKFHDYSKIKLSIAKHTDLLKLLWPDVNNLLILQKACKYNYIDTVKLFINNKYPFSNKNDNLLLMSFLYGNQDIVNLLIDAGVWCYNTLELASHRRNHDVVIKLLKHAKIPFVFETVLMNCITENWIDAVKLMLNLEYLANNNRSQINGVFLDLACYNSNYDITRLILEKNCITKIPEYIFYQASQRNDTKMIDLLNEFKNKL